ncbi:MAG: ribosome maturation factor RimP [Alphaproteobacteria bacterium]|nr:ribosome maturation factor RimP [Alphaproteobacteria bacterium]
MKITPLERKIADIAAPVIQDRGFELVCVHMTSENGAQLLRIMAEDPATGNLGIDDCAVLSKAVSVALDVEDPIKGTYRLELSSPGIDRPLVRLKDFETYTGLEAKLEMDMPDENGQKRFRGRLKGLEGETIRLETDQGEVDIPFGALAKAKLVLTDELIQATAKRT